MNVKWPLMHNNISRSDANSIIDFLSQDPLPILTNASKVKEFEQKWGEWLGTKYNVMVNSGSAANELSLLYLKYMFPEGGEVIVPPLAWVSDVAAVLHNDFTPVFCDIKINNLALDIEDIKRKITPKTKAILLIHILGYNGISKELIQICKEKNILLIEDVCESHGATFNGQKVGTFGDISNFSFYYAHHMTTIEGGMISTNDSDLYDIMKMKRSHGLARVSDNYETYIQKNPSIEKSFLFVSDGYNFRNTEIGAVLGLSQLKRLGKFIENRRNAYLKYVYIANRNGNFYPVVENKGNSSFCFPFICKTKNIKQKLITLFEENGIEYRPVISGNILMHPAFKKYKLCTQKENPNVDILHKNGMYVGNSQFVNKEKIDLKNLLVVV